MGFHCCVSGTDGVNVLLVEGPQLVPFLVGDVSGGPLSQHELAQGRDSQTPPQQTLWKPAKCYRDDQAAAPV